MGLNLTFVGPAGFDGFVAAAELGERLLQQHHPQLVAVGARVDRARAGETGKEVVHAHALPPPVFAEAHAVHAVLVDLLGLDQVLHQLWELCQCGDGAEEPAVTEST